MVVRVLKHCMFGNLRELSMLKSFKTAVKFLPENCFNSIFKIWHLLVTDFPQENIRNKPLRIKKKKESIRKFLCYKIYDGIYLIISLLRTRPKCWLLSSQKQRLF